MKKLLALLMLTLPCTVYAEDCQVVEYPDHFDVTCTGDAKPVPIPKEGLIRSTVQNPVLAPEQTQVPDQQNNSTQQAVTPAEQQTANTYQNAGSGGHYTRKPGRQGRPSTADMNAAIEARRKLIQEQRLKNPTP